MRLVKFLSILEKIIILLIILCFIPIAFFAYLPRQIIIPTQLQCLYTFIKTQAGLTGFLTKMVDDQNCSIQRLALMNDKCMERCNIGVNCFILQSTDTCKLKYSYRINQTQICSEKQVTNNRVAADTVEFNFNSSLLPISNIVMNTSSQNISLYYYCIKDINACRSVVNHFGPNLQQSFADNYQSFSQVVQYLMLFGLMPLVAHTLVVFVLDSFCRFNLRLTNSLMIINEALTGAGIIIAGISLNSTNDMLTQKVRLFGSQCLIQNASQCQFISESFGNFNESDDISSTFVTLMCFILALEVLLLIGVVAINILMIKYYKLREIDPQLSGYELQTL